MSKDSDSEQSGKRFSLKSLFRRKATDSVLSDKRADLLSGTNLQTPQNFLRTALKLSKYWASKQGAVGWAYLSTIVGMSFFNTYMGLWFAHLNTDVIDGFNKAYELAKTAGTASPAWQAMFGHTMGNLGLWAGVTVVLIANAVYSSYFSSKMAAHWRINMTHDLLNRYQKHNNFHRLQHIYNNTDNPEQRIQEDVNTFTSTATSIPIGLLNASLAIGAYSHLLWDMSKSIAIPFTTMHPSGWMLGVTFAITGVMTLLTYKVTKPLVHLTNKNQELEADFRFNVGEWRKHSEAVAFYDGAKAERGALNTKFNSLMKNVYALIDRNKAISWVQTYYGQATDFVPFLLLGPAVMTGAMTYGQMIQARIAMAQVNSGLSWPLNSMPFFAGLKATTNRLATLTESMDRSTLDYESSHPDEEPDTPHDSTPHDDTPPDGGTDVPQNPPPPPPPQAPPAQPLNMG